MSSWKRSKPRLLKLKSPIRNLRVGLFYFYPKGLRKGGEIEQIACVLRGIDIKIIQIHHNMKYFSKLLLVLISFSGANFLTAQVGRIESTTITYEDKAVDALTVTMKPARKDIQKAFDDWMDDRYDINMKGGGLFSDKNLRSAEAVTIPAVSPDNISLFVRTEERGGESTMTLFASRGLENFIGKREMSAFAGLEDVFDSFLSYYLPEYYQERVAEAQEMLADLRDDFSDKEEKISKNDKEIKKLQKENAELREELKSLERDINAAERTLDKRKDTRREVRRKMSSRGN